MKFFTPTSSSRAWRHVALVGFWLTALLLFMARAGAVVRYGDDQDEVGWMKQAHPAALVALEQGEALLGDGKSKADLEKAVLLFRGAAKEAPESALLPRRWCEALTALGRHDEAVTVCDYAFTRSSRILNMRAMAGALMSGQKPPSGTEVGRALYLARRGIEMLPEEPWGYAAQCDVAAKLGDVRLLRSCTAELERVAPRHYETARAAALLASKRPGLGILAGWLVLIGAALGTVAHAFWSSARRSAALRSISGTVAVAALLASPRVARAEDRPVMAGHMSGYPLDPENPESSVPTPAQRDKDPLEYGYFLMDVGDAADKAILRGDHAAAAKFYRTIVKAVPDSAVGYRKACEELEKAGNLTSAKNYCAGALTQADAVVADYSHYARVVFASSEDVAKADIANLDSVVTHLKKEDASRTVGWDIECNLGVRLADTKRLQDCTVPWAKLAPNDSKVIFYSWVLALHEKNYTAAYRLVKQAKSAASPPAQVRQMEQATFDATPFWRKGFRDWRFGALVAVALFGTFLVLTFRRRSPPPTRASAS